GRQASQPPLESGTESGFNLVASDGENFYGDAWTSAGVVLSVVRKTAAGAYEQTLYPTSVNVSRNPAFATGFQYGAGYLAVTGIGWGAWDLQLFRLESGAPVHVDIGDYFRLHYGAAAYLNLTD